MEASWMSTEESGERETRARRERMVAVKGAMVRVEEDNQNLHKARGLSRDRAQRRLKSPRNVASYGARLKGHSSGVRVVLVSVTLLLLGEASALVPVPALALSPTSSPIHPLSTPFHTHAITPSGALASGLEGGRGGGRGRFGVLPIFTTGEGGIPISSDAFAVRWPALNSVMLLPARSSLAHGGGLYGGFDRAPLHRSLAPLRIAPLRIAPLRASANPSDTEKRKLTRKLDKEFFTIAFPAFIQFSAEPLASLVNTMYLGRVGTTALAAAGVAISAQYSVSKLYNDPLLRTSISLVASGQGKKKEGEGEEGRIERECAEAKTLSRAVSSALLLAVIVGVIQTIVYGLASHGIIRAMGVSPTSDMFVPAVQYLQVRAVGSPGMTLWLVANGIFRGLGDTVTPLKWALVFTGLNAILDPIFIFYFGLGCPGAAIGMVTAQYIVLAPLLLRLRSQIGLSFSPRDLKDSLKTYLTSGGFVLIRTIGKIVTYAVCAREAALLGTVASAAYNICFQLGTATTQICESISVAAQALLARELARDNVAKKRVAASHVIKRAIAAGGCLAFLLSMVTWVKRDAVVAGLSTDPAVQAAAMAIMPLVLWTQVCKGFAYPVNGITMGALDWRFLSVSMWVCNAVCLSTLLFFKPQQSIFTIWIALCLFMSSQCLLGVARLALGLGPWRQLRGWSFRNARRA